uniref:Receptor expression-enhancing protein n=1 Tax=Rhabditophanes sp. KR3021 TaxID=114890 RepID=A0AC35UGL3_9BILA
MADSPPSAPGSVLTANVTTPAAPGGPQQGPPPTTTSQQGPPSATPSQDGGEIDLVNLPTELNAIIYGIQDPNTAMFFKKFEESTGAKREHLVYGIGGLLSLYLIVGSAASLVCNLIGSLYPAYRSVTAVKSVDKEDDTQWLIYWCVFSAFSLVDFFAESLFSWFPIYWLLKALFLLYLSMPRTKGALKLYNKVIEPLYNKINATVMGRA